MAFADDAVVQFPDGSDFRRRAGEEGLIGEIDIVAGEEFRFHAEAHVFGQGDDGLAGDAVQRRREFRLVQPAVLDDEQVLTRAFGHVAVHIEQQRLVVTVVERILVGQDGIEVSAGGFRTAHVHVDVVPRKRRRLHADALAEPVFAQIGTPWPGRDGNVHVGAAGRHAHLLRAIERDRPHIAGFQLVHPHHFLARLENGVPVVGHLHHENMG